MSVLAKYEKSSATPVVPREDPLAAVYGNLVAVSPLTGSAGAWARKSESTVVVHTHSDQDHVCLSCGDALAGHAVLTAATKTMVHEEVYSPRCAGTHLLPVNASFVCHMCHSTLVSGTGTTNLALSVATALGGHTVQMPGWADTAERLSTFANERVTSNLVASTFYLANSTEASTDRSIRSYLDQAYRNPTPDLLASYDTLDKPNWDGQDAEPITRETLNYARRLLRIMPDMLGLPDIAPAADGSIALEWVPEGGEGGLDRLFLDIGPGEQWRAYWRLHNGEFGRLPGDGYTVDTRRILHKLFDDLSR